METLIAALSGLIFYGFFLIIGVHGARNIIKERSQRER